MAQFGGISGLGAPIDYYETMIPDFRAEALQETQNRLGQQQVIGAQMQNQQMQRQISEEAQLRQALPEAINDPAKLQALALKYPTQRKAIQDQLGFKNEQDVSALNSAVNDISTALKLGPEAMARALVKHNPTVEKVGSSAQELMKLFMDDPNQLDGVLQQVQFGLLGAKDRFAVKNDMAQRQNESARLAEQVRSNRAGEAAQWANIGIAQQNANIRKLELEDKKFDRQIARESNQLQQDRLRQEMASNREKSVQAKTEMVGAYDSQMNQVSNMLDTVNQVKGSGGNPQQGQPDPRIKPEVFDRIFGFGGSVNSMVPGTESADAWQKIQQMQGQARLMGVIGMKGTGPVSDSEGQAAAKAFLSINQSMSPKAARAAINNWEQVLRRQETYLNKQRPTVDRYRSEIDTHNQQNQPSAQSLPQNAEQQGGYSNLWGG